MKSLALLLLFSWWHHAVLAVEVPLYEQCPEGAVEPMKKLLCYYEGLTGVDKINPCLCTHIVYTAAARVSDNFTLQVVKDHERTSYALRKRNPTLKIVLSVAGNASQSDALAKSDAKRQQLVQSVAAYVAEADVDGVEVDFAMSTKGGADAKESFAEFMKLLREKIDSADVAQSRQKRDYSVTEDQHDDSTTQWSTIKRNLTAAKKQKDLATHSRRKSKVTERAAVLQSKFVFLRVPIEPEVIAKRFDLKFIAKYVDNFIVATDNITDASEKGVTYHPSRLMGLSDILNMDSMLDLLTGLGAPHGKLIVSLPAATTLFTLADDSKNTPRSPVLGLPTNIDQAKMCSMLKEGGWTVERDEDLSAPYAFRNNTWMAFEDRISAGIKGKYVVLRDLGGAALYRLDDEDTVGACANLSDARDSSLLASLHYTFTNLARKSRQALLQTLQEEIHESTLINYSGDVHLSPFRIVRVVDLAGAVHIVRKDAKTEFECSRQGYFSHPLGCNRFYRCVKFNQYTPDYTVFEYDCPAGLAFDERWEVCVWPGSLPQGSPCTGSSEIAPVPRARYSCPTVEGYYADPENCRWFFACLDHARDGSPLTAYEFRCPFGLVFDEKKLLCDWPWSVEGCGATGKAFFVGQAAFGYAAHSSAANLQINSAANLQLNSGAHFEASQYSSGYDANSASFSSSESFGNGGSSAGASGYIASGVSSSGASGYIAGGAESGSSSFIASGASSSGSTGYIAGGVSSSGSNGYIAGGAESGSYYEGRDTASYGSYPDYLVSGGRIEQSGGVILGEHVKASAGLVGIQNAYSGSFSGYEGGSRYGNEFHSANFEASKIAVPVAPVLAKVPSVSVTSYENANAQFAAESYQGVRGDAGFYQSTATPIVRQEFVSYSPPVQQVVVKQEQVVVKQPVAFYQSTPRPIEQVFVKQPVVEQQVFYQSTPRPVVQVAQPVVATAAVSKQEFVSYRQPVVQKTVIEPAVAYFAQSTPRPLVQQVQYQQPIVQEVVQPVVEIKEPQVFYQSTPRPIVKQVQYQTPVVQQEIVQAPQVFYQSTPRPIVKQVQYQTPIVQQQIVQEPQVFYQSTPRPIVKQVEIQTPVVQQPIVTVNEPQVFYQSTPRPIVKQVQYQAPVVHQQIVQEPIVAYKRPIVQQPLVSYREPQIFFQSTPRPIVKQVQYQTPIVQQQIVQEPQVFYQSTPRPIVKQVQYQTPIVQQQIVQEPQVFYQSTPRPIVKQVQYQTPIVQQQIVQEPQVFYQSTPRPIVKQVQYQTPIVQAPQVFYQSTPRPIVKQVEIQTPIVQQEIVQEPQVFYQSTPRPIVKQVQYQTPIVQQQIVQEPEPQVFYQSTPRPIVKQVQYQTPIVQQEIVQEPQVFYQSTPRPIVKQVQYQTPIVQQKIVQEPQVFYQSTPRPIVKQVQYQTPIVQQEIVQEPQVFYQSTPRPIVKQVQYKTPIAQQQIVQEPEPQVFYQSTPRPVVKQVQYQQPIVQQKIVEEPQVFYQSTPRPIVKQVQYQQPIVEQRIVEEPRPQVFYQSTPRPIVKQVQYQEPIIQQIVQTPKPTVYYSQTTPAPIIKQVTYRPQYQQVIKEQAYVTPTVIPATYQTESQFGGYSYSTPTPQYKVSTTPITFQQQQRIYEARQQEVSVSDNGEYGNINQAEINTVQVSTPAPAVVQRYEAEGQYKKVEKAQVYDAYKNVQLEREYLPVKTQGQAQQSWTSYDSRYDVKDGTAQFVNEGLVDLGYEEKYQGKYEENYEERAQEVIVEKVTQKPAVFEQYFRETSPPKVYTTTQRPVAYSAPDYLPPSPSAILEATTFRYEQRPRFKAVKKQKVIADVDALLNQYSGNFGGIVSSNEGFISDVIADDLAGSRKNVDVTTPDYVEVTTFRPRKKSRKRPTSTTTASYEEDDNGEEEEVEIKKSKQPVVVVTQLSDANPLLIAKLGAKCTCQSERVSLRKKNRNRDGGAGRPAPSGAYAADLVDSVPGDYDDNGQIVTSTLVPVSKDGDDVPVVRIRPSKRPTVSRVPSDIGVDALVAKTRRPQVSVEVDALKNIPDLEQRYVKSGLRNPGYQYRKPKIPVVIDIDDDSDDDNDNDNDGPTSTLRPIIVDGPSSIPVVVRRPASNLDFGRFPQEKSFKPIVVQEPFTLVTRRPYIVDGQSSNVAFTPEVVRRRPESARRRLVVSSDGEDEAVRPEGQRRRPESARRGPANSGDDDDGAVRVEGRRGRPDGARGNGNAVGGETVKFAGKSFDRYGPGGWRSVDETLQGSVDCQRPGLFRHPKYCNKFYACHWDNWKSRYTLHVFNCPVHLSYDTSLGACNWPTKGPACVDDNLLV